MNARAQTLVLTLVGVVGVQLVVSGAYLRYVNDYMRWPLLLTSVALILMSLRHLVVGDEQEAHPPHRAAWALVLPAFVVFVISPPALGAYVAERRPEVSAPRPADVSAIPPLPSGSPVDLEIIEFDTRAEWDADASLRDREVRMDGFVTRRGDDWFLTRLATTCCAADAVSWRVRVVGGGTAPAIDQWVRVTGVWRDPGTSVPRKGTQVIDATSVVAIAQPRHPYM